MMIMDARSSYEHSGCEGFSSRTSVVNPFFNEHGLATVEAVPLIILFVMLAAYAVGLFGVIHTGILQSIAARTYAFETFRNRTNLTLFRETGQSQSPIPLSYVHKGVRLHSINSESAPQVEGFFATERPLTMGYPSPRRPATDQDHLEKIYNLQPRNQAVEVAPVWVMIVYGMCMNSKCGDP